MAHAVVIRADLDELVFRARNKSYGAYVLRRELPKRTIGAFIAGSVLFALLLASPVIYNYVQLWMGVETEGPVVAKESPTGPVVIQYIPPIEVPKPPVEQPQIKPAQVATVRVAPPQLVPDRQADPTTSIAATDSIEDRVVSNETREGGPAGAVVGDPNGTAIGSVSEVVAPKDPGIFDVIEGEMPAPLNMAKLNVSYPTAAKEAGIQGMVVVRVLVSTEGTYEKHVVIRSPHKLLTDAVEPKLKNLQFKPAMQANKPVRAWVTIPFRFNLK